MNVHMILWVDCDVPELRWSAPFVTAAQHVSQGVEAFVIITCPATAQSVSYICPPGACWGWRYFRDKWIRKFGPPP